MKDLSVTVVSSLAFALAAASALSCTVTTVNGDADGGTTTASSSTSSTSGSAGTSTSTGAAGASATTGTGGAGTGGAGGAATGGAAGNDGGAMTDASSGPVDAGSDPCSSPDPGNEDRDHATPYFLGAEFKACLQTQTDVDYYEFTTPASPVGGGVVVVNLTDVGTGGSVDSTAYAVSDNGEIHNDFGGAGTSVFYWFDANAATRYRVSVKAFSQGNMPNPYTMKLTYAGIDDPNEPNDTKAQSKAIAVGTAVHGYFFAGYATSTAPNDTAWDDWLKVTLAAGSAQIALTDLSSDIHGEWSLFDSNGTMLGGAALGNNPGSSVVDTRTGLSAGDYFVKLSAFSHPTPTGNGSTLPDFTKQAYTVTVTQP